jgi:hypothetical protein
MQAADGTSPQSAVDLAECYLPKYDAEQELVKDSGKGVDVVTFEPLASTLTPFATQGFMLVPLAASDADPIAVLVNYGAIGLMLAMFVLGRLHSDRELNDLKEQNAKLLEALTRLQGSLTTSTLPALTRSTQVLEAIPSSENALMSELQRTVARLEALARADGGDPQ